MNVGESPTPQFGTAEYAPADSRMSCAACRQPISGPYFQIRSSPVCGPCAEKVRAQVIPDSHAAFVRALACGIVGALIGLGLYVAFALATGLIIGYVSLAVGFIVGKAMHMGSGGVGGRRYQLTAVVLTYLAVSMSAVPIALAQTHAPIDWAKAVGPLAWVGIASPLLDLRDPVQGLIGLVILFVGIRFAWRFTADRSVKVSGPYAPATPRVV
jgi:hypothetical protein